MCSGVFVDYTELYDIWKGRSIKIASNMGIR